MSGRKIGEYLRQVHSAPVIGTHIAQPSHALRRLMGVLCDRRYWVGDSKGLLEGLGPRQPLGSDK